MWGKTQPGPNKVGQMHGGDTEVDWTPLNALNTSEVVVGWATRVGDKGG